MGDFTISERQFYANTIATGSAINLTSKARTIDVWITSSEWDSKAGQGKIQFGFQKSTDNGQTWELLVGLTIDIGYRNAKGLMPNLHYESPGRIKGTRIRAFVLPAVDIKVGFTGTWV